jgi:glycosyltransferase involved in cell wall biosynthesis
MGSSSAARSRIAVAVVAGDDAVGFCGVGDYAHQLVSALQQLGVEARHVPVRRGRVSLRPDEVLHLQYPSRSFGSSLAPWVGLAGARVTGHPTVVTLHEHTLAHPLRKAANSLAVFAHTVLFTTAFERDRFHLRKCVASAVVPIGTNIDAPPLLGLRTPSGGRVRKLVSFGRLDHRSADHRRVLLAAETLAVTRPEIEIVIVGSARDDWKSPSTPRNVRFVVNPSDPELRAILAGSDAALQYYADGAGERRGSLLACLAAGLPVLTNHTELTDDWIRETTVNTRSEDMATLIDCLEQGDFPLWASSVGERLGRALAERRWDSIAARHLDLYEAIVGRSDVRR